MRRASLRIVYFLVLYLPLEDFVLKWIPVPYTVYLGLRQVSDALVLVGAGMTIAGRMISTRRFRIIGRAADLCLVFFVVLALGSAAVRGGDIILTGLNLKAQLRYILLIYILINLRIGREEVRVILKLLYVGLGIQFVVSVVQLVAPYSVDQFFFPRVQDEEVAGVQFGSTAYKEAEKGYVFGTMANTISYAGFLLTGLATYVTRRLSRRRTLRYWGGVLLFIVFAFLSGSRAATFAAVLVVGADYYLSGRIGRLVGIGSLLLATLPFLLPLIGGTNLYVFEIFSAEYVEEAKNQRLGTLLYILPSFLTDPRLLDVLFGLSVDQSVLRQFVERVRNAPTGVVTNLGTLDDVYWIALFVYYGAIGLALFGGFYASITRRVYRISRDAGEFLERRLARTALLLLLITVPLSFIAQYFETRQFSFFLWLLVGLSLSYSRTRAVRHGQAS